MTAIAGRRGARGWPAVVAGVALIAVSCAGGGDDSTSTTLLDTPGDEITHTFVALDAGGPVTKQALSSGEIDVGLLFTSSAGELSNDWIHLDDDRGLQPVENFIPAIRSEAATDDVVAVVDSVSAELTNDVIQAMVARVTDGDEPASDVAADFLASVGIPSARTAELTAAGTTVVGSASFPESEVMGELYAQALLGAGILAGLTPDLGFREVYFPALENGDVDLVPEFVGSLLTHLGGEPTNDLDETLVSLAELAASRGVELLEPAPAESKNGFYVTAETAEENDLTTVSDLAGVSEPLVFGGPAECPVRPLCVLGLQEVYGLAFDL